MQTPYNSLQSDVISTPPSVTSNSRTPPGTPTKVKPFIGVFQRISKKTITPNNASNSTSNFNNNNNTSPANDSPTKSLLTSFTKRWTLKKALEEEKEEIKSDVPTTTTTSTTTMQENNIVLPEGKNNKVEFVEINIDVPMPIAKKNESFWFWCNGCSTIE